MALTPTITIDLRDYEQLREDSSAFQKIKKGEKFVHYSVWCGLGGLRTEITSNDDRVEEIKKQSGLDCDNVRAIKDREIFDLHKQIKDLQSRSLFKRLFS